MAFSFGVAGVSSAQNLSSSTLPDSPGHLLAVQSSTLQHREGFSGAQSPRQPMLQRVVPAGMGVQSLTAKQKFELSIHSRLSLEAYSAALFGAVVEQLEDSRPHYGTDKAAFGERLGAASLRQASDSFFSYGLYAALTHEDPHYYVMGRGERLEKRAVYAASRIVITRTDAGGHSVNWAKLAGLLSATLLTNAYYPPSDRGPRQTVLAYFSNLGTSAATLELHEFMPDVKRLIRRHH